jgi:hypothetical protein
MTVKVRDSLQDGYSYKITEKPGRNFDPVFKPELTPQEMLRLGVFGGNYFEGNHGEFPKNWFAKAKLSDTYDIDCNYFHIRASQSRDEWIKHGWIHKDDPRGWFQWYCRYYLGRRHSDDARQIKRWYLMRRHINWLQRACGTGNSACRPRQRQALLHWAYDSRKL